MLKSDLCDYGDTYIVVKGTITVEDTNPVNRRNKKLTLNDIAPFIKSVSKIDKTLIDNAEDLDIVILIYNLLEYSDNYFMTSESLWNYYRNEVNDDANYVVANRRLSNNNRLSSNSFEYKAKIKGRTPDNNDTLDTKVVVPLKYLSYFWRYF